MLHQLFNLRRSHPLIESDFITPEMYDTGWKELHDFLKYIFKKRIDILICNVESIVFYTESYRNLYGFPCVSHFRVRGNCCACMSRHADNGNYSYVSRCCISYYFSDLLLAVESSMWLAGSFLASPPSDLTVFPHRADFRKFWITLNFYSPSLVISEVPV